MGCKTFIKTTTSGDGIAFGSTGKGNDLRTQRRFRVVTQEVEEALEQAQGKPRLYVLIHNNSAYRSLCRNLYSYISKYRSQSVARDGHSILYHVKWSVGGQTSTLW